MAKASVYENDCLLLVSCEGLSAQVADSRGNFRGRNMKCCDRMIETYRIDRGAGIS